MNIAKTLGIPAKSAQFFADLANDAGNWSGYPWLDGNVSAGKSSSAMSQTLVRHGLITVGHGDEDQAFAIFTTKGIVAAAKIGIDLRYTTSGYFSQNTGQLSEDEAEEVAALLDPKPEATPELAIVDTQPIAPKICKKNPEHGLHRITRTGSYCYTCDREIAEAQKAARKAAKEAQA